MGRIYPLNWLYLRFVCGIATDAEVTDIWVEVAANITNQEGLAVLPQ